MPWQSGASEGGLGSGMELPSLVVGGGQREGAGSQGLTYIRCSKGRGKLPVSAGNATLSVQVIATSAAAEQNAACPVAPTATG